MNMGLSDIEIYLIPIHRSPIMRINLNFNLVPDIDTVWIEWHDYLAEEEDEPLKINHAM